MTAQPKIRYYGYSPALGRHLLLRTDDTAMTDTDRAAVIEQARRAGFDNVVRETGPVSRPEDVVKIWERGSPADAASVITVWDATGTAWTVRVGDLMSPGG